MNSIFEIVNRIFTPRVFENGSLSPIQKWISGDWISLDQLIAISEVYVEGGEYPYEYRSTERRLSVGYSLHYMPAEVPFIGIPPVGTGCLKYSYGMSEYTTTDKSTIGSRDQLVSESTFTGRTTYRYYKFDLIAGFYEDQVKLQSKLNELINVWELYRIQKEITHTSHKK